jgi:hypothetical protein
MVVVVRDCWLVSGYFCSFFFFFFLFKLACASGEDDASVVISVYK